MEFGLPLPDRLAQDRGAERQRKKEQTLAEKAQYDETGIDPVQLRAEITEAYRRSDSAEAFQAALKEKGYVLSTGDRRAYVVVDRFGKVHSLARQIEGVRTRDLNKKLLSIEQQVAGVDEAKAGIRQRDAAAKLRIDQRVARGMAERSAKLSALHRARRQKLDVRAQELATIHAAERM
ncbi:hypothetical protein [Bradyrhizobium cajani]|uniref:hypothetical protein n=1 Tax=Bradyrhizobium cajani TaxID=1928661 RepID=UPI00197AA008|nr:hypothetical protein [Bradyrhizobium cajani]MCP3368707.1 hypothetical protein [Bradyrhizobium cajani]